MDIDTIIKKTDHMLGEKVMLNYIWTAIMILSIVCAVVTGRMNELSKSILEGAQEAVNLTIYTLGIMSLWTGLMKIADAGKFTDIIAKMFRPLLKILFPDYTKNPEVNKAICMNLTANILGLGNAATPFGITAMQKMQKCNKNKSVANRGMIMFVVLNTCSLQAIPTMIIALRQKNGTENAFSIVPLLWIVSICGLIICVIFTKILEKVSDRK